MMQSLYSNSHVHFHRQVQTAGSAWKGEAAQWIFLAVALSLFILWRGEALLATLAITFVSIILEAFPFMLIGTLIGGFIEVFVHREWIAGVLPSKQWITCFLAAGLGMIFPVCECAVVPVVHRLLRKGIPLSAAIAYLLGGPIVNPLVAASTAVAYTYSWQVVAIRLLCGYMIAVCVGIGMDLSFTKDQAVLNGAIPENGCEGQFCSPPKHPHTFPSRIIHAIHHAANDFYDIGRFLVIGAFLASLLNSLMARHAFVKSVAVHPILSVLLMMGLAFLLSLCSEADAFVAASFRETGLILPAQMGFMVLGPMLDIKLLLMYLGLFKKRAIIKLAGMTVLMVFLTMLILEMAGL
jgi:uncharacterized membrane protein YraQ (UPF0718 family)